VIDLGPKNTGFRLTFSNGWTISVQFGEHNYAEGRTNVSHYSRSYPLAQSAEIAAFPEMHKGWHKFKCLPDSGDDVYPCVPADLIAQAIAEVAALPPYQETSE